MASNITSAGAASGMDFESIISATLEAKRVQLENKTTVKLEEANIELSGVGSFKSALEAFQSAMEALNDAKGFNTRKITTSQPTDNPYFTITAGDDAANGTFDIAVKQLASTEKISQSFGEDAKFQEGKLTITIPGKPDPDKPEEEPEPQEITIDVPADCTVAQLRRLINEKAGDYGISASVVETSTGSKLTIDSGLSGAQDLGGFTMKFEATDPAAEGEGAKLNYDGSECLEPSDPDTDPTDGKDTSGNWNITVGKDAIITVDGDEVRSTTNSFDTQISGLELTVNRVTKSDKTDDSGEPIYDSYQVDVSQDVDAIVTKVQSFISAYNSMMSSLEALGKRNTYTDGSSNYDGGDLAGDSQLESLTRQLQSMMTSLDATTSGVDLYSVGLEVDDDGVFSLDTTKFKEGIKENFNAIVNLFSKKADDSSSSDSTSSGSGTNATDNLELGLITRLDAILEEYTKSGGILAQREDELNQEIKDLQNEENDNETYLAEYEESLRAKYANLDTTIAGYNTSLTYLQSVLG